jgi:hypothetical protein
VSTDATQDLRAALETLHARLDAWHHTVVGVAAETAPQDDPLVDPRLEAASDAFQDALGSYEEQTLRVLGLEEVEAVEERAATGVALGVLVDDFFVHLVVGVREDEPPARLTDARGIIDESTVDTVVDRLEEAGFVVPEYRVARGELDLDDGEDEP